MSANRTNNPVDGIPRSVKIAVTNDAKTLSSVSQNAPKKKEDNYYFQIFQSVLNMVAHLFIGVTVGLCLMFSLRNGLPLSSTHKHVILCVIGYQLLMAEAILSMSLNNGWSAKLKFVDKRRAHWILLTLGSVIALYGSYVQYASKGSHWNSLHSQFSLVAIVFTIASLVNGLTSLWAYELRGFINDSISKITHICFGIIAFGSASISLCYGFKKGSYRSWATESMSVFSIVVTIIFTVIIIINPCISFYRRSMSALNKTK